MDTQKEKKPKRAELLEKMKLLRAQAAGRAKDALFTAGSRDETLKRALILLAAFFLARGEWLFGCFPFGIALLSAASEHLWLLWAGCALGAFFVSGVSPFLFLAVYTLLLALRLHGKEKAAGSGKGRGASLPVRTALSCVVAFIPGLYRCISEGFSLHALFALLFYIAAAGVMTFLYDGFGRGAEVNRLWKKAAYAALLFSLVYSLKSISIFGFSPCAAAAVLFCLVCARSGDYLSCGALGLILGIACGRSYALPMALIGFVSAAFGKYNKKLAPWLAVLSGFALAFYNEGSRSFLYVLPDLVGGLLVFIPVDLYLSRRKERARVGVLSKKGEEKRADVDLPGHLLTLGEKIEAFSREMRMPDREAALRSIHGQTRALCASCAKKCFDDERFAARLAEALFKDGSVQPEKPPVSFLPCPKKTLICESVNNGFALYLRRLTEGDRALCCASCYKSASSVFSDRVETLGEENAPNDRESAAFSSVMKSLSFRYSGAEVRGARRQVFSLSGVDGEEFSRGAGELLRILEERLGKRFSPPVLRETPGGLRAEMRVMPRFSAENGYASAQKKGETLNGDTLCFFTHDDFFYALICDGMGSGREAALISRIACRFFKELTEAGAKIETALAAINDFLLYQSCETSTTLDLLRLDLLDGRCDFVKCGACDSLVLRGSNTFKISSPNLPLGSARRAGAEKVSVRLRAGDRVIMTSDGAGSEIEGSAWFSGLFPDKIDDAPDALAKKILAACRSESDDRSVIVVSIADARGGQEKPEEPTEKSGKAS